VFGRALLAAVVLLALAVTAAADVPALAGTNGAVGTHKLVVAVTKNLPPAAERKLAVLVLVSRNGGPSAGALATPSKPLTVLQSTSGPYRVKVVINAPCTGSCAASARLSGSAGHRLEVVPSCRLKGSGFVCSKVRIVKVY
jgi:hypothetical protein